MGTPDHRSLKFFPTAAAFRAWLAKHHAQVTVLQVGFYKKDTGRKSITYPEALDQALCYGWIDGVRHKVDELSYTVRFTPRKPTSEWSAVNLKHFRRLRAAGLVTPAGLAAFERRDKSARPQSIGQRSDTLDPAVERKLRANRKAWAFFQAQPNWVRRNCAFWVMSAKKDDTKAHRLATLIDCSARGEWIPSLARATGRSTK